MVCYDLPKKLLKFKCVIISVLYNTTKTLAFASYFCEMRVKILYWLLDGELKFPDHFRSLTDNIFQYKFRLWLSGLLNRTIESDLKVLNHVLLALASDHDEQKTKPAYKIFAKNKPVKSTDHEAD